MSATVDDVLVALGALGSEFKPETIGVSAEGFLDWHSRCPVCEGSLTIAGRHSGPATLSCENGCDPEEIEGKLDIEPEGEARTVVGRRLSEVRTERPRWLWQGRIPLGVPTLLVGREKTGKSTLTVALAAGVTRGTLEGDLHGTPSGVVMLSYEDHAGTTVKPRVLAAEGDPARVVIPEARREGVRDLVSLPADVDHIGALIREHHSRLIIVDPFSASLGAEINNHRDQDVRRAIASLAQLAEAEDAALVLVAHFNKAQSGDSLSRVLGSRGLTAAVRSVLVFGKDPDAEDDSPERVLAHPACNIAAESPSLACRIVTVHITDDDGEICETSKLEVLGETEARADDLLVARSARSDSDVDDQERGKLDEAAAFLEDELTDGPLLANDVRASARELGITPKTLRRAQDTLGIRHGRLGGGRQYSWWLPGQVAHHPSEVDGQPNDGQPNEQSKTPVDVGLFGGDGVEVAQVAQSDGDGQPSPESPASPTTDGIS